MCHNESQRAGMSLTDSYKNLNEPQRAAIKGDLKAETRRPLSNNRPDVR